MSFLPVKVAESNEQRGKSNEQRGKSNEHQAKTNEQRATNKKFHISLFSSINKRMIDKNGKEVTKTISYRLKFIYSTRFLACLLSNVGDNLAKGIHKTKCRYGHEDKKCEICGIKYKDCDCFLKQIKVKNDLVEYKCLFCNKRFRFAKKTLSIRDINKFILLLRKGVYPYEYIDDWEKFHETSLPEKEDFYGHLNMEDIAYAD